MDAVERHVTLPTDLEAAWDLLTRPDDQAGWLGADVVLDPTPGAAGRVVDHDGTVRHLTVEEVDAGTRLTWHWWTDDERAASRVEITLTPDADGTRVTVIEAPLPSAPVAAASVRASAAAAWSHRLLHLEALLLVAAAVRG
jgi:uncharacterized protein YndB with AHSA1/START domain